MPTVAQSVPKRGPGRPPDVNGDDTKREIVLAARRLFAMHGYFSTTTRMIALEVGVTPAALHHYFGRKKDLVLAVYESTTAEEYRQLDDAIDAETTFIGKVQALIEEARKSHQRDRHVAMFMAAMREEARRTEELKEILEDTRAADIVRNIVEFGVSTGAVDKGDAAAQWRGVISALWPGITLHAPELSPKRMDAMIEGCKRLVDRTL